LIVLDTNVLSELMRPQPSQTVMDWLRRNAKILAIPSVAIGELRFGVARLTDGRRKASLSRALDALIQRYASVLLPYDVLSAIACGDILASAEAAGRPMSLADAQIAGIARVARAILATRNGSDFATTRLKIVNPWSE
jgi:predicted nucleic acid-binding protein